MSLSYTQSLSNIIDTYRMIVLKSGYQQLFRYICCRKYHFCHLFTYVGQKSGYQQQFRYICWKKYHFCHLFTYVGQKSGYQQLFRYICCRKYHFCHLYTYVGQKSGQTSFLLKRNGPNDLNKMIGKVCGCKMGKGE